MNNVHKQDWDPRSDGVRNNQCSTYDAIRRRCPIAYSDELGWSVFRHEDVKSILDDHETYSNITSHHRSVPNGLDPPEHTAYRKAIEKFFSADRMRVFEPVCRNAAQVLLAGTSANEAFDLVDRFAMPYSSYTQCAFLGWPADGAAEVRDWARRSLEASRSGDRDLLTAIAAEFRARVRAVLYARRQAGDVNEDDVIGSLLRTKVNGAPLSDDDIASVLRNWTVGELGSLASGIGIVVEHLATTPDLQSRLRVAPALIPVAIEEILRVSGPLVCNRRRATRDVVLGGRHIAAGERLTLMWIAANRDDSVFEQPEQVHLHRDLRQSLLFGAGIHICPGAPLARLELRVAVEELLAHSEEIALSDTAPRRAVYPANGWESLPVQLS